jgi:hypothetical protein
MNTYAKHTIQRFHLAYTSRLFDQDDVALLLVLARDYAPKGTVLRELGDFLAHPQEKTKGIALSCVETLATYFEEHFRRGRSDRETNRPTFKGLATDEELRTALEFMFELSGLPRPRIRREDNEFREFVFCVICLLGTCKVKYDGRTFPLSIEYSHSFSLQIHYESRSRARHFAVLPLLQIHNVWIGCPTLLGGVKYALRDHVARRFAGGLLAAIPFELDNTLIANREATAFAPGSIWPIPEIER